MRKNFTYLVSLIIGLVLIGQTAFSGIVPVEKAQLVAKNMFYERVNLNKEVAYNNIFFSEAITVSENGVPVYYVFNLNNEPGFVLVSAESNAYPVLGYSFESYFFPNNLNIALEAEIQNYKEQIASIRKNNYKSTNEVSDAWEKYSKTSFTKSTDAIAQAGPLVLTKWDQSCYYNTLVPAGNGGGGYCNHLPTGCVSTAMAQIMKFWAYPSTGAGSNSYTSVVAHNVNFATSTYNYAAMPLTLTGENAEVAKLIYHAGVSVNMQYAPGGSSASTQTAAEKFKENFKYASTAQYVAKASYDNIKWHILIRAQILSGKPVMYRGTGNMGGHAFIVDGFQYPEYYHVNFGWGGSGDGYYYFTSLNSSNGNGNFTQDQGGIINLYPSTMSGNKISSENDNMEDAVIYPNPNNGSFSLMINNEFTGDVVINVLDMTSRLVESITINKSDALISHDFNFSGLSKGLYYVSIENNGERLVKKFIVK